MRFPNKVTTYKDSVISSFPIILRELEKSEMPVMELFFMVKKKIEINDFIDALDCLYALGAIDLDVNGVVAYVERDIL